MAVASPPCIVATVGGAHSSVQAVRPQILWTMDKYILLKFGILFSNYFYIKVGILLSIRVVTKINAIILNLSTVCCRFFFMMSFHKSIVN